MIFFKTALIFTLKRLVQSKAFLLSMALLPVMLFATAGFLQNPGAGVMIRAGVAFDSTDAYARAIADALPREDESGIRFEFFGMDEESIADMRGQIMKGELECGYVFGEELAENIKAGQLKDLITLIKSPKTIAEAMLNETVSAAVIRAGLTDISTNELVRAFRLEFNTVRPVVEETIAGYYGGAGQFVNADQADATAEGKDMSVPVSDKRILHGIIALYLLIVTAFTLPRFIDEKNRGILKKFVGKNKILYALALFAALLIFLFFAGFLSLGVVWIAHPAGLSGGGTEAAALLFYAGALAMIGLLLISALKKNDWIYAGFAFVPVIVFCLGGIVFDLTEISAKFSFVPNLFLTGAYINFILYEEIQYLGLLFLVFIVSLIGTICFSTKKGI